MQSNALIPTTPQQPTQPQPTRLSSSFVEPRTVSIHHDGVEVIRIVDGRTAIEPVMNRRPSLLEIYWDGRLVYRMRDGNPEYNTMLAELQSLKTQVAEV